MKQSSIYVGLLSIFSAMGGSFVPSAAYAQNCTPPRNAMEAMQCAAMGIQQMQQPPAQQPVQQQPARQQQQQPPAGNASQQQGQAASVARAGIYKKGKNAELQIKSATATAIQFKLVVNGAPGKVACEEGDVSCLEVEGRATGRNGVFTYKGADNPDNTLKITVSAGAVTISDSWIDAGTGQRSSLGAVNGRYGSAGATSSAEVKTLKSLPSEFHGRWGGKSNLPEAAVGDYACVSEPEFEGTERALVISSRKRISGFSIECSITRVQQRGDIINTVERCRPESDAGPYTERVTYQIVGDQLRVSHKHGNEPLIWNLKRCTN